MLDKRGQIYPFYPITHTFTWFVSRLFRACPQKLFASFCYHYFATEGHSLKFSHFFLIDFSLFSAFSAVWWMIRAYRWRRRRNTWRSHIVLHSHQYITVMVYSRVPCRVSWETLMTLIWFVPPDSRFIWLYSIVMFSLGLLFCSWMHECLTS